MIRYYGLYPNAHWGQMRKTQEKANPCLILEEDEPFVPSKGWAEMIRHLKLNFQAEQPPPSHVAHQELLMAAEESRKYL